MDYKGIKILMVFFFVLTIGLFIGMEIQKEVYNNSIDESTITFPLMLCEPISD